MGDWQPQVQMTKRVDRGDGRTLMLFVGEAGKWLVGAVETSTERIRGDDLPNVLDDHQHKVIGSYETIRMALDAADSFAAAWLKNWKSTRGRKCDCEEMS